MKTARFIPVIFLICAYSALTLALTPTLQTKAAWDLGGNPVVTEGSNQEETQIVEDGEGGFIVLWVDGRFGADEAIYAQRFDSYGNALWAADGVPVCTVSGMKDNIDAVADGSGGVIAVWDDYRGGYSDMYIQKLDADGIRQWNVAGYALCTAADYQNQPAIVSDGTGGAIIAWMDHRDGVSYNIYARRVDAAGSMPWPTVWGEPVCMAFGRQSSITMLSDREGGAFIAWEDYRNDMDYDIYMSRIDSSGNIIGTADGWAVCTDTGTQANPKMVWINDLYHAIVWNDGRSIYSSLYVQLYLNNSPRLVANGVELCSPPGASAGNFDIVADGQDQLIACWTDTRLADLDVYAQCFSFGSGQVWTDDGVVICTAADHQWVPTIVSDGNHGAIISWYDGRNFSNFTRCYAQRIDPDGNCLWEPDGLKICSERSIQRLDAMIEDGNGGAFIVMLDGLNNEHDIYAQKVDRNGYIGSPEPSIHAVTDVPGDQGGQLELSWYASYLDPIPNQEITHYTIWKSLTPAAASLLRTGGASVTSGFADGPMVDPDKPVIRIETLPGGTYFWELIDSQTAQYYSEYSKVVATDFSCTTTLTDEHYFQIAAHTSDPLIIFTSAPDSGCAWDDLSPAPPVGFNGEQEYTPEGLQLTWEPNSEPDVGGYYIYRGLGPTFAPNATNQVATVEEIEFFDDGWDWETGYWYKIAAFDVHDNVSGYTLLGPSELTGEDLPGVPGATYLGQNYPNPFNPVTTIRFGLSAEAHVNLRIYDPAGRLVRVLVNSNMPAGHYNEQWDGLTSSGTRAASGVYFYKLAAGEFVETRKMVLLR